MTPYPSNRDQDWTSTQAAPWQTSSPDTSTMGAYFPPTSARPTAPVAQAPSPLRPAVRTRLRMVGRAAGVQLGVRGLSRAAALVCTPPRAGLRGCRLRRRRGGRSLRCAARVLAQRPGEHGNPCRTGARSSSRPGTGTHACRPAGRADLPDVVAFVDVQRQLLQGGEQSNATSEPAASACPAVRSVVLLGSLAVEQQWQLSVELLG